MSQSKEVAEALTIESLKETIKTLEETKLNLLLTVKDLKEKLNQQKDDQADIYFFLNKKCDESFEIISTLEEQLLNEQADREIAEKMYESKLEELRNQAMNTESRLQSRISELEGKLEMLNNFAENKDEAERIMKELMNKLEEERAQFRINADTMENRFLLEREKLRKSYDIKYEGLKKELESSIDGKLSSKTQRTQIMNVIMKKELDTQSRHAERLLEINEMLIEKERAVARELDLSKGLEHETLMKLHSCTRKLKSLEEQLAARDRELQDVQLRHKDELEKMNKEAVELARKVRVSGDQLQKSFQETDELWQFLKTSFRRFNSVANSSNHEEEGGLDDKEPHERLLLKLLREIALKFPEYLARYVKVGFDIQQRSKAGISSWDQSKKLTSTQQTCKATQTDFWEPSSTDLWLRSKDDRILKPPNFADFSLELDNSSIGAFSVPTLIGKGPPKLNLDSTSVASEIGDGYTVKSANIEMLGAPPIPNRKYHRKPHRQIIHPLDAVLGDRSQLKPHHSTPKKKPVESRKDPVVNESLEMIEQLPEISVAGRKFVSPIMLPRL